MSDYNTDALPQDNTDALPQDGVGYEMVPAGTIALIRELESQNVEYSRQLQIAREALEWYASANGPTIGKKATEALRQMEEK